MSIRERMQRDLRTALKDKDRVAVTALRTALAAIANAEAVPAVPESGPAGPLGARGLGNDVPRRDLRPQEVLEILRSEAKERRNAMAEYAGHGRHAEAERIRAELDVLERYAGQV